MASGKKRPKLTFSAVVEDLAERASVPKHQVTAILTALRDLVADSLEEGIDVDLGVDFGRFTTVDVKGREYFVPKTGETSSAEDRRKLRFKPSPKISSYPPLR